MGTPMDPTNRTRIEECSAFVVVVPTEANWAWLSPQISYALWWGKPVLSLLLTAGDAETMPAGLPYEDVTGGRMPGNRFVGRLRDLIAPASLTVAVVAP